MIEVKMFGTARLALKMKSTQVDADNVKDMLKKVAHQAGVPEKKMKQYLIFVNEINIDKLHRFRTKLHDGDTVMILSPSSGG